ncbi:MAG: S26 family signal peptidase [Candidatus Saccharimonadales bacterium]
MVPNLEAGQKIIATSLFRRVSPGQVIIVTHLGKEKVKRVERVDDEEQKVFVIGDNLSASTDSRHFGWLNYDNIIGKVIWPDSNLHKD